MDSDDAERQMMEVEERIQRNKEEIERMKEEQERAKEELRQAEEDLRRAKEEEKSGSDCKYTCPCWPRPMCCLGNPFHCLMFRVGRGLGTAR